MERLRFLSDRNRKPVDIIVGKFKDDVRKEYKEEDFVPAKKVVVKRANTIKPKKLITKKES
jgi:hypothetical protein